MADAGGEEDAEVPLGEAVGQAAAVDEDVPAVGPGMAAEQHQVLTSSGKHRSSDGSCEKDCFYSFPALSEENVSVLRDGCRAPPPGRARGTSPPAAPASRGNRQHLGILTC